MKNTFKEYYRPSEQEFGELWNTCIFVPDSNVLLSLYRFSSSTAQELIDTFSTLSGLKRLWIPHQVGFEYHKNRLIVISEQMEAYDAIIKDFSMSKDQLLGKTSKYRKHPFISLDKINKKVERLCTQTITELEKRKNQHPNLIGEDTILFSLNKIFEGKIGGKFTTDELEQTYKDGGARFLKKIPPGYEDKFKQNEEKYGDYVVWRQILNKAKEDAKPIIFITDDIKEDWWLTFKGQTEVDPKIRTGC